MKSEIRNKEILTELIYKKSGIKKIDFDADLESQLNITGDDALELMIEISETFGLDTSQFHFPDYFYDEVYFITFSFRKLFRTYNKKKLSANDLLACIQKGELS